MSVGVIGLGVGTLAAWSRPGDTYRFYEINPAAERLAREYFTFLRDAEADVEVVLGDGRIALEEELAGTTSRPRFDVLIIESFQEMQCRFTCSRWSRSSCTGAPWPRRRPGTPDHQPACRPGACRKGLANAAGLQALRLDQAPPEDSGGLRNAWMWLAAEGVPAPDGVGVTDPTDAASVLWTDDFSNLIGVLR